VILFSWQPMENENGTDIVASRQRFLRAAQHVACGVTAACASGDAREQHGAAKNVIITRLWRKQSAHAYRSFTLTR